MLLQESCRKRLGWDKEIDEADFQRWRTWLEELPKLKSLEITRCLLLNVANYLLLTCRPLHHFADASSSGYGVVSYLRMTDKEGNVTCCFVFGNSRLAPVKSISIPKLELTIATLPVKIDCFRNEPLLPLLESHFWTDSTAVLQMINSCNTRFPTFVANRLTKIEECLSPSQWHYVGTHHNPADEGSTGLSALAFVTKSRWLKGPEFLFLGSDL